MQPQSFGPAALQEQKLGDEVEYLRLATREHAGSTTFRTGAGHIHHELMERLPRIEGLGQNRATLCHRIEEAIYPLAARLLAQAVEITLNFSPAPQDFPTAPPTMLTATGFDIGQRKIIHAFIPPKRQRWASLNRPEEPVTVTSGLLVTCRPLRYRYHALKDTRKKWKHIKSNIFQNWSRRDLQRFEDELKEITAWLGKKPLFNPALWKSAPIRKILEPITPEPEKAFPLAPEITPAITSATIPSLFLSQGLRPLPPQNSLQRGVKPAATPRITTATETPKKKEQTPTLGPKTPVPQTQPTPIIHPQTSSTAPPRLAPVARAPDTVTPHTSSTTPLLAPLVSQQPRRPFHTVAPIPHKTTQPSPTPRSEPTKTSARTAPVIAEKPIPQRLPELEAKQTAPHPSTTINHAPPHGQKPSHMTTLAIPKPGTRKEAKIDLAPHEAPPNVLAPTIMTAETRPTHTTTSQQLQPQPASPPQQPAAPKPVPTTPIPPPPTPQHSVPKEQPRAKPATPTAPEPVQTQPQQQMLHKEPAPPEPPQQTQTPQTQQQPRPKSARVEAQPQQQTEQQKPNLHQQEYAARHEITRQPVPSETRPKPSPRIAASTAPETRPAERFRPVHDFEQPLAQRFRAHQYAHQQGLRMEPRMMPKQRPVLVATAKLEPKAEYKATPKIEPKASPKAAPTPRQQPQNRWAFLSPSPAPSPSGFFTGKTTRKA